MNTQQDVGRATARKLTAEAERLKAENAGEVRRQRARQLDAQSPSRTRGSFRNVCRSELPWKAL